MINSLIVATGLLGLVLLYLLAQASGSTSLLSDHYWLLLGLNALLGLGLACSWDASSCACAAPCASECSAPS